MDACQPVDAYQPAAKYLSIDGDNNRLLINSLLILIWRKHYTKYMGIFEKLYYMSIGGYIDFCMIVRTS